MNKEIYAAWAPDYSIWSPWVKPVLFNYEYVGDLNAHEQTPSYPIDSLPDGESKSFIVVDLEGARAVATGVALAHRGYRPVPLFNGVDGKPALVPVDRIIGELDFGAPTINALSLPANAPPAFLLDSNRLRADPRPKTFDNRWVVVPEDFPSANRLLAAGLRTCILISDRPVSDLPHVLRRFHAAGIAMHEADEQGGLAPFVPQRPALFRTLFARALVLAGLQRSSAGGFGAIVPEPSQGGSG